MQTYALTSELLLHLRVGESYEENLQTYHHIHHPPSQFHLASLTSKKHQSVV